MPNTPRTAAGVIAIARAEVGYREGRSNGHWNNDQKYSNELPGFAWSDFQAWCCTFVAWCSWRAGFTSTEWPRSASCDVAGAAFKARGRWSPYPAVGAQIFFGTPNDLNHTGIVTRFEDLFVWTIEGNTNSTGSREGDGVYEKQHRRDSDRIQGYGYPIFDHPIVSADPAWARVKAPTRGKPADKVDALITSRIQKARANGNTDGVARWKAVRSRLRDRFPLR